MTPLVIFGAGGHAREIIQIVADINRAQLDSWQLLGVVADVPPPSAHTLSASWLGDATWLAPRPEVHVAVAVGDPAGRSAVVQRLRQQQPSRRFATLIHPSAWLANSTRVGEGSIIFAGCLLNADVEIGTHVNLNLGCTLSHDVRLGDYASLGPGVHLAGGVHVGASADVGVGAVARPRTSIGANAVIGAGAVVVSPIPENCLAVGVPARPLDSR